MSNNDVEQDRWGEVARQLRLHGGQVVNVPDRVWAEWQRANEAAHGEPKGPPCDECEDAGTSVLVCTAIRQIEPEALSFHCIAAMSAPVQGGSIALDRWVKACEELRRSAYGEVLAA